MRGLARRAGRFAQGCLSSGASQRGGATFRIKAVLRPAASACVASRVLARPYVATFSVLTRLTVPFDGGGVVVQGSARRRRRPGHGAARRLLCVEIHTWVARPPRTNSIPTLRTTTLTSLWHTPRPSPNPLRIAGDRRPCAPTIWTTTDRAGANSHQNDRPPAGLDVVDCDDVPGGQHRNGSGLPQQPLRLPRRLGGGDAHGEVPGDTRSLSLGGRGFTKYSGLGLEPVVGGSSNRYPCR